MTRCIWCVAGLALAALLLASQVLRVVSIGPTAVGSAILVICIVAALSVAPNISGWLAERRFVRDFRKGRS